MPTISRDFDSAVIELDGTTVRITGTTTLHNGATPTVADERDDVTIYVSIIGLPLQAPLVGVADLSNQSPWPTLFPDAAGLLNGLKEVHVVGLALEDNQLPVAWEGVLSLSGKKQ